MYWINLHALENQIIENRLSNRAALSYVIANALLYHLLLYIGGHDYEGIYLLGCLSVLLLIYAAIQLNYNTYNRHGGKDFFKVYWAIGWVVGFRLLLLSLVLIFTLFPFLFYLLLNSSYAESITQLDSTLENQGFNLVMEVLFTAIIYILMNRSLKRVALGKPLNKHL